MSNAEQAIETRKMTKQNSCTTWAAHPENAVSRVSCVVQRNIRQVFGTVGVHRAAVSVGSVVDELHGTPPSVDVD